MRRSGQCLYALFLLPAPAAACSSKKRFLPDTYLYFL